MRIKGIHIAVAVFLYLIFRKDDGLLPTSVSTTVTKFKNAIGMQKGGINNPGNIRSTTIQWKGEITKPGDTFESYSTLESGIRAMYLNLMSYRKRGIDTIGAIISTWAPKTENDTENYISVVSKITKIPAGKILQPSDYPLIISAMSKMEGNCYVTPDQVKAIPV